MEVGERDRVFGCIFGLAVGDALGAPLEGIPREEVRQKYGKIKEMIGGGWLNLRPGEFTDDTELALIITKAIQQAGGIDLNEIANGLIMWMKTQPKDIGGQTYQAIEALMRGVPPEEAGRTVWKESGGWLAGNSCIMRTPPIGLYLRRASFERRTEASKAVASITHGDPRCLDSASLIDHTIAFLSLGDDISFDDVFTWARGMNPAVAKRIESIPTTELEELQTGGFVLDTLQTAFWFLFNSQSFEEALIEAVSLGHDADTTGAVTGALLGAKLGINSIPKRWLDKLTRYDEVEESAKFLFECAPK